MAKAYRALADLGLITLKQGRGRLSRRSLVPKTRATISCKFRVRSRESLRKARGLGIPEAELRQMIDEQITASYRVNLQRAAFVECNLEDARAAVDEIEAMTGYRLVPLLLDDLQSSPLVGNRWLCGRVHESLSYQRGERPPRPSAAGTQCRRSLHPSRRASPGRDRAYSTGIPGRDRLCLERRQPPLRQSDRHIRERDDDDRSCDPPTPTSSNLPRGSKPSSAAARARHRCRP